MSVQFSTKTLLINIQHALVGWSDKYYPYFFLRSETGISVGTETILYFRLYDQLFI